MNDQYDLYCLQHIENTVHSKVEEADDVFCACAKYLAMMHKTPSKVLGKQAGRGLGQRSQLN